MIDEGWLVIVMPLAMMRARGVNRCQLDDRSTSLVFVDTL